MLTLEELRALRGPDAPPLTDAELEQRREQGYAFAHVYVRHLLASRQPARDEVGLQQVDRPRRPRRPRGSLKRSA